MKESESSYNRILKSTTVFGGSQALVIIIGLIRTKIIAILLGTFGVGLIGIYQSLTDIMRTGLGLGMDTAGVKEIAAADNKDRETLNKTVSVFNKWFLALSILALLLCAALCYPISIWTFGNGDYTLYIALLSVAVAFLIMATGRSVVLQGMRRITEMAKAAVWGSVFSLIVTIPIYYIWRIDGIIPALIANGVIVFLFAEYYYRKQGIKKVRIAAPEAFRSGTKSLKLGIYIVIAGSIGTISMFAIRAFISRNIDVEAAGLFQSVWVITNVYIGVILKSMSSDFYPHLSVVAGERGKIKALVNEQTYIVLIIASPIIIGMLLFSDFALSILYSSKFAGADGVLRWQMLGTFLKVLGWPVSFILLVKNKGLLFLATEIVFYLAYLLSAYFLYPQYGLDAAGIGYFVAYIIYFPVIMCAGYKITGFHWNKDILTMTIINIILIASAFYITVKSIENATLFSLLIFGISLLYTFFKLRKVFTLNDLKGWFKKS